MLAAQSLRRCLREPPKRAVRVIISCARAPTGRSSLRTGIHPQPETLAAPSLLPARQSQRKCCTTDSATATATTTAQSLARLDSATPPPPPPSPALTVRTHHVNLSTDRPEQTRPCVRDTPTATMSTDYGNFHDFCRDTGSIHSTLPVCNLFDGSPSRGGNGFGGCNLEGIDLSGGRNLANLGM